MRIKITNSIGRLLTVALLLIGLLQTTKASENVDGGSYTIKEGETMYIDASTNSRVKYITQEMGYYYKISSKEWTVSSYGYIEFVDNNTSDYRIRIKGKKAGTVTLTFALSYYWVSNGNVYYSAKGPIEVSYRIKVTENPPTGIKISPTSKTIGVGQSFTTSYTLTPSDAVTTITWSSDNTGIAYVSSTGKVTGKKAGSTYINVKTANGCSASCKVDVVEPTLEVNPASTTAFVGDVFKLSYTIKNTNQNSVTWSTEDSSVATVNSTTGEVTAIGVGTTNIVAKSSGGLTAKSNVNVIAQTDISQIDNVIYIIKEEGHAGAQLVLPVQMKNSAAIRGFQFDLHLPEGVTVAKNNKGRILASLNDGRREVDDEHALTVAEQEDGGIRFLCGSQYDETFTGNNGEILTVTLNIAEDMEDGDYPLLLKNIKLTETDISKFYETAEVKSTLTVSSYTPGDINGDGKVDVSDYIGIANRILGNTPEGFNEKAADINEDSIIDVSDYIGVANIILKGSIFGN